MATQPVFPMSSRAQRGTCFFHVLPALDAPTTPPTCLPHAAIGPTSLSSRSAALYIGVTGDLHARLTAHRNGTASLHTRRYRITRLVHCESTDDIHAALAREKQLKTWSREKKLTLIRSFNPAWDDPSDGVFVD